MICSNCKTKLSCGCQKAVARDGKSCCAKCVTEYNNTLPQTTSSKSSPSSVSAKYLGPGKQH